jgi:hypothetical protein
MFTFEECLGYDFLNSITDKYTCDLCSRSSHQIAIVGNSKLKKCVIKTRCELHAYKKGPKLEHIILNKDQIEILLEKEEKEIIIDNMDGSMKDVISGGFDLGMSPEEILKRFNSLLGDMVIEDIIT